MAERIISICVAPIVTVTKAARLCKHQWTQQQRERVVGIYKALTPWHERTVICLRSKSPRRHCRHCSSWVQEPSLWYHNLQNICLKIPLKEGFWLNLDKPCLSPSKCHNSFLLKHYINARGNMQALTLKSISGATEGTGSSSSGFPELHSVHGKILSASECWLTLDNEIAEAAVIHQRCMGLSSCWFIRHVSSL